MLFYGQDSFIIYSELLSYMFDKHFEVFDSICMFMWPCICMWEL
uniref:Uncharacterized protein n=1 Tax=Rhizophora mucronata TaxID=61149 RepID=A0A2P2N1Q3_RHIMU